MPLNMKLLIAAVFAFCIAFTPTLESAAEPSKNEYCSGPSGTSCDYTEQLKGGKALQIWGQCRYPDNPGDPQNALKTVCSVVKGTNITCNNSHDSSAQSHCECHNWAGKNHTNPFKVRVQC